MENLYKKIDQEEIDPKLKARLLEYKEQAFFSQYLATVKKDAPIDFNLAKCQWKKFDKKKIIELFEDLDFKSLIKRLPET